jgi:hypothetical protein
MIIISQGRGYGNTKTTWCGRQESNLQRASFEDAVSTVSPRPQMAYQVGIEPTFADLEAAVLPLDD